MEKTMLDRATRLFGKAILLGVFAVMTVLTGCDSSTTQSSDQSTGMKKIVNKEGTIVAVGDSLTAGFGLIESEAFPALLEQMLIDRGYNYRVVNGGISGETSSGVRTRLDWIMKLQPDIVILETGANDGLRGIEPKLIKANIDHVIARLHQADVTVVLTGMQMTTNLGPDYVKSFNQLYPDLAGKHKVVFMPFFLKDVATEQSLNQPDGIHPNRKGYEIIASNLLPYVEEAIQTHSQ